MVIRSYRILLVTLGLLLSSLVWSATETVKVTAEGYGETPQHAVSEALVGAVRQAGGVALAVDPSFRRKVGQWLIQRQGDVSTWIGSQTSVADPQLPTLGSLRSYQVLSVDRVDDALWKASVEARVLRYQSLRPGRGHLPAIAVMLFETRANEYQLGEVTIGAAEVQGRLRDDLVDAFTQAGRFRVLDRAHQAVLEQERVTVSGGSVEPAEWARLGRVQGADVLLVGRIEDFSIGDRQRRFYGADFQGFEPRVRIRYRMLDTATGEVLWSDLFDWRQDEATVRAWARLQNIEDRRHPERLADRLYPSIARALSGAATDVLYPVRVLKVSGDMLYLSQGAGRLETDAMVSVYRPGEQIKDPDTGLPIQLAGAELTRARVIETREGYALARVTRAAAAVQAGDRVRVLGVVASGEQGPAGQPPSPGSSEAPIRWD
ncbi:CsgG/HfaB family protein [Alloalcanivorax xenomutans]|uniref:CsgG/HfaB family protein n=1 Tax=Alloalcanivorax xenomutans TaxID=1094342 RepID=UPI003BA975BD